MKIIVGKIDVTKIDKSKLFKGQKGTYLDINIRLNEETNQYGDHGFITQGVSKQERDEGKKGAILGNVKVVFESEEKQPVQEPDDDLPF